MVQQDEQKAKGEQQQRQQIGLACKWAWPALSLKMVGVKLLSVTEKTLNPPLRHFFAEHRT
jgi:hypothetical protein